MQSIVRYTYLSATELNDLDLLIKETHQVTP